MKLDGNPIPASSTGYLHNDGSGNLSWGLGGIWNQNGNNIDYTNGNVGIGTTNPQYPLDVNGNAAVTGNIYGQNIYAANQLSAGNFRFVNGVVDTVADSIVSNAPVLQLSANKVSLANNLSVTANSFSMPGIIADTTADTNAPAFLMSVDKTGNITPISGKVLAKAIQAPWVVQTLRGTPVCSGITPPSLPWSGPFPFSLFGLSSVASSFTATMPCEWVGVGNIPDAPLTVST